MLIKVGNNIVNTSTLIDAKLADKGEAAVLTLRFAANKEDGTPVKIRFKGDAARGIWELLEAEAQELPYTGD